MLSQLSRSNPLVRPFLASRKLFLTRHSVFCIDGHTCGNPVRLDASGGSHLNGATMIEKRAHFLAEFDWVRTGSMFEPRGHDLAGSLIRARQATTANIRSAIQTSIRAGHVKSVEPGISERATHRHVRR